MSLMENSSELCSFTDVHDSWIRCCSCFTAAISVVTLEGSLRLQTPWTANKGAETWRPNMLSDLYRLESVCIMLSAVTQLLGRLPAAVWFHSRHWTLCLRIIQFQPVYNMLSVYVDTWNRDSDVSQTVTRSRLEFLDDCLMGFHEKFVKALTHYTDISCTWTNHKDYSDSQLRQRKQPSMLAGCSRH